mmetsp:Transcript_1016/g.3441  ORF Transcript_1016/g.3441 Transcript_1016/m.3441 type:complete len:286 (-) Transcript_1016:151-1008(-)
MEVLVHPRTDDPQEFVPPGGARARQVCGELGPRGASREALDEQRRTMRWGINLVRHGYLAASAARLRAITTHNLAVCTVGSYGWRSWGWRHHMWKPGTRQRVCGCAGKLLTTIQWRRRLGAPDDIVDQPHRKGIGDAEEALGHHLVGNLRAQLPEEACRQDREPKAPVATLELRRVRGHDVVARVEHARGGSSHAASGYSDHRLGQSSDLSQQRVNNGACMRNAELRLVGAQARGWGKPQEDEPDVGPRSEVLQALRQGDELLHGRLRSGTQECHTCAPLSDVKG